MKDNREFCVRSVMEMLVEIRGFEYQTLIAEHTQYVCGFLTGLMYADVIERDEFMLLCKLAGNAMHYRDKELTQAKLQKVAA